MKKRLGLFISAILVLGIFSLAIAGSVNLNTATKAELEALPGVGEKMADDIIQARPFKSVDDLRNVKGVGDSKFNKLKGLVSVDGSATGTASATTTAAKQAEKAHKRATESTPSVIPTGKIDLNTATKAELEALPGVGGKMADDIIGARPFKTVDDLKSVKGIGDAKFSKLSSRVTVGGATVTSISSATTPSTQSETPKRSFFDRLKKTETIATTASDQSTAGAASKLAPGEMININTASSDDLQKLPGIGPKKAEAIIAGRPYSAPEDVMKVKGIKEGIFKKIVANITVK